MAQKRKSGVNERTEDTSPFVHQKPKLKTQLTIRAPEWTEKQNKFIEAALDKNTKMIIVDGVAGTGKTLLSVYCSLVLMNMRRVSDLVYIRSTVQTDDGKTGFLTGDLNEKMMYFNIPLQDKLEELLDKNSVQTLIKEDRITAYPTAMLRGYNFAVKAVVADEAQNFSFDSICTVATRMGEFSKLFLVGDSRMQNDYGKKSGFKKFCDIFNTEESKEHGIVYFNFGSEDIMRSGLTKYIVEKIEAYNDKWGYNQ